MKKHPFDRSGLAALTDLQTPEWREIFECLEKEQREFLKHETKYRSPEYIWPRDPLHTWSRVWEYPYIYYHIKKLRKMFNDNITPKVIDFGCGVTFFPFMVAKLGYNVLCIDRDPVCRRDILKAIQYIDYNPGELNFIRTTDNKLPFKNEEIDVIYSISVFEHIKNFDEILSEISRILKPNGLFLLTVDIDLRGDARLNKNDYKELVNYLYQYFNFLYLDKTIHPMDILTSLNSKYPLPKLNFFQAMHYLFIQYLIKPLIGKKSGLFPPPHLSVFSFALRKNN